MRFLIIGLFISSFAYCETRVYTGIAKSEGKTVYLEKHTTEFKDKKIVTSITEYTDPAGKVLGILKNNYEKSLNAPVHEMEDLVNKNKHGLRYDSTELVMYSQDKDSKEKVKKLDENDFKNKLVVGGQGLHYYLVDHLEDVIKKGKLDLKFLIPGRLDAYDFYLKVVTQAAETVNFEIEIDNWFLRLFAPKLKLVYDRKNGKLLNYTGLSNIKNEKNDLMNVQIEYSYEK